MWIAFQAVATLLAGALVLVVYGPHEPLAVPALRPMVEPGRFLAAARQRRPALKIGTGQEQVSVGRASAPALTGPLVDLGRFTDPPSAADALERLRAAARWSVF